MAQVTKQELTSKELASYIKDGFAPSPKGLGFLLTHRCNLRCEMCFYWGDSGTPPATDELLTQEVKELFDRVKGWANFTSLGGGEPLMRKDLLEILEYANQLGLRCEILTNGTLITPKLAEGIAKWAYSVIVSIEGPEEINDSIRGKGTFKKATRGIRLLHEAGDIPVRINTVISSLNYQHLEEMVDIARNLKCSLSFQHLIFGDSLNDNIHQLDATILIKQLNVSWEKAYELGVNFHTNPRLKGDREIEMWYSGLDTIPGMGCLFPWTWLFIRPDGEVRPCEFIDYSLGNILKEDLEEIWNGDKAQDFRKSLRKGLRPACMRCCKLGQTPFLLFKELKDET